MRITLGTLLSLFYCVQIHAYNLPQHTIKSYDCEICETLSHESLQDHWPIAKKTLTKKHSNIQKSYRYTQRITAVQLQQGVRLALHAPGAVLRIIPLEDRSIPSLELKSTSSPFMPLKDASSLYSQDEAVANSLKISAHQTMLQIKPELGFGNFILKSNKIKLLDAPNNYLLDVFEKSSTVYLEIEPDALEYQYGDEFHAVITLRDDGIYYPMKNINATLVGPNNETIPLSLNELKHNQYQASTKLLSAISTRGGNWYLEVDVSSEIDENNPIYRTGHAAFSYSIPSASLISIKKTSSKPLTFAVSTEVATASRYALQSILYKKSAMGEMIPVETTQSAAWLEPGKQVIEISFDNADHLTEDQLSIGYLHLTDYGQLKPVYQYDTPIQLSQTLD